MGAVAIPSSRALWLAVVVTSWSTGCLPRIVGHPVWVVSRQPEDYPAKDFIVGAGESSTREQAETNSIEDLLDQTRLIVDQALRALRDQQQRNHQAFAFNPYPEKPTIDFGKKGAGVELATHWSSSDGSRHASLAILDRRKAAAFAIKQAQIEQDRCLNLSRDADLALEKEPRAYLAVKNYLGALLALARSEEYLGISRYLTGNHLLRPSDPKLSLLLQKIDGLLSGIKLQAVHGDGQRVDAHGSLPAPLTAAVAFAGDGKYFPVTGLPLAFHLGKGTEPPGLGVRTNEFGTATVHIQHLEPQPETNSITARVDAKKVLVEAEIDAADQRFQLLQARIEKLQVRFHFITSGKKVARVALVIAEKVTGELEAPSTVIAQTIKKALTREGFEMVDTSEVWRPPPFPGSLPPEKVAGALKSRAEVLVFGQVEAKVTKLVTENFVFAKASGKLQVMAVDSGQLLSVFEEEVEGAGIESYRANDRALKTYARKLVPVLLDAIRKLSGTPP